MSRKRLTVKDKKSEKNLIKYKLTKILYINCLLSYFNKISRVKTTSKRDKNTVMSRGSCLLTYFNTHYIIIL